MIQEPIQEPTTRDRWLRPRVLIPAGVALAAIGVIAALVVFGGKEDNTAQNAITGVAQPGESEPRTLDAAVRTAQLQWDRRTAGDYAGVYDLLDGGVTSRITKNQYVSLVSACDRSLGTDNGLAVTVADPRWANETHTQVTVMLRHPLTTVTRDMIYETDRWLAVTTPETLALITTFKNKGQTAALAEHCTV